MKVLVVNNLADIAEIPQDKTQPIITRDGGKLVTMSIVGSSPMAAIMGTMAGLMNTLDGAGYAGAQDKTLYILPGSMNSSLSEHRFTIVIGVTGVVDLEDRLKALPKDILANPAVAPREIVTAEPSEAMSAPGV